jgi:hypothetical protein
LSARSFLLTLRTVFERSPREEGKGLSVGVYLLVFLVADDGVSADDRDDDEKLTATARDVVAIRSVREAVERSIVVVINMMLFTSQV